LAILAPGGEDTSDVGDRILQQIPTGEFAFSIGTSMAAPHAAALGALILAQEPNTLPSELYARIVHSAHDKGTAGRNDEYGWGLINPLGSLISELYPRSEEISVPYLHETHDTWKVRAAGEMEFTLTYPEDEWDAALNLYLYDSRDKQLANTDTQEGDYTITYETDTSSLIFYLEVREGSPD